VSPWPDGGAFIENDDKWIPLGPQVLREHALSWVLEGTTIHAPQATTWWVPYDREAIMRYGQAVNTAIPEDANEAEFPDEPWPDQVVIRIKSSPIAGWR
jgi:hypothetical protein